MIGAALLLPTAEFRAVGGFDERFFMNAEEVDLQRRLRDRGLRSVVLAHPSSCTRAEAPRTPSDAGAGWCRRALAYADKWGGRRRLQGALAVATAANFTWNVGRRVAGRPVAPLRTARDEARLLAGRRG